MRGCQRALAQAGNTNCIAGVVIDYAAATRGLLGYPLPDRDRGPVFALVVVGREVSVSTHMCGEPTWLADYAEVCVGEAIETISVNSDIIG